MKRSTPLQRKTELKRTPLPRLAPVKPGPLTKEPKRRMRKCAIAGCRLPFEPRSMSHKVCGPDCAAKLAVIEREKADRKDTRERLAKLKRRADYLKEAQQAVNAYVRERDADKPCISCGRWHEGQWHAGHFLTVGARPGLRFELQNIHKQCMPCNVHLSGNLINYRLGLIARIGVEAVEALECDDCERKYTVDELIAIKSTYKQKLRELQKSKGEIT